MKCTAIVVVIVLASLTLFGQENPNRSVIIGDYTTRPNAVLALNPTGKNQGFLLPQLTSDQRISIPAKSPEDDGLVVFDITLNTFYHWSKGAWVAGLGSSALTQSVTYNSAENKLVFADGS